MAQTPKHGKETQWAFAVLLLACMATSAHEAHSAIYLHVKQTGLVSLTIAGVDDLTSSSECALHLPFFLPTPGSSQQSRYDDIA